ncbi:hypothetical protein INT46_005775 [Mucor plumbeus]|uniref:Uncharacterized protein n=1 Tax=Mucor plumbeus TaxID=97098 RepID=A0A8H7QCR7_9FUNG|nr:hypothetical protein INT46_005775 [Mucor plumbeus]
MSAFNNNPNNATLNNTGLDGRTAGITGDRHHIQPTSGQLNENHGIAATGLNEPHTHATVPTTQGTTAERHSDNLNFSGPPVATNKVDQAGSHNPSDTNRTAGTGIPPVNTAEHARQNATQEALSGHHGHHDNHHNIGTGVGTAGTASAAAGAGYAAADKLSGNHHNTTGTGLTGNHHNTTGLTGDHHNTTGTGLTGNHHNTTGTGLTGDHHNTTGTGLTGNHHNTTGLTGDHHNTTGTGLTGNHHNTTGTGLTGDHHNTTGAGLTSGSHGITGDHHNKDHNLTGASAVKGDHGASHHGQATHTRVDDSGAARISNDAAHPTTATGSTGAAGAIHGGRHAGEPQHEGLLPNKKDHHHKENATTNDADGKASAGDKIKGNLEKIAGKISGNESKVIAGENKAAGRT